MNFILKPPLEHIALVKVATVLWNHRDIRALILEFLNSPLFLQLERCTDRRTTSLPRREKWQTIEDKVIEKLPQLMIPVSLKEKLLGYIQAVGLQILKWMEYHLRYIQLNLNICLDVKLPNEFCWTSQGTIDQKKTAEVLIKDEQLDITTRYKLACMYCLEDDIPELWNVLLQSKEESICNEEDSDKTLKEDLAVFGGFYVQGKISKIEDAVNDDVVRSNALTYFDFSIYSISKGNRVAFEHFLKNLKPSKQFLIEITMKLLHANPDIYSKILEPPKEYYTEIFCLFFSQMNNEQQIKVFENHSRFILVSLLDWPWQGLLIETAGHLKNFLSEKDYYFVCAIMLYKVKLGFKDYDYHKMFQDFWQQIPHAHKRGIVNNDNFLKILCYLFQMQDKEITRSIIQDVPSAVKEKLLLSDMIRSRFEHMIAANEWEYVQFFFRECLSSRGEKTIFKQVFKKCIRKRVDKCPEGTTFVIARRGKFFHLLNEPDDKRKTEDEGNSNPAKRFCKIIFEDMAQSPEK